MSEQLFKTSEKEKKVQNLIKESKMFEGIEKMTRNLSGVRAEVYSNDVEKLDKLLDIAKKMDNTTKEKRV